MSYRVSAYRNCAKPDCNAHNEPTRYEGEIPSNLRELQDKFGSIYQCSHCGIVWIENRTLEEQVCYIVRRTGMSEWLDMPTIERYKLKTPRKTYNPRRYR